MKPSRKKIESNLKSKYGLMPQDEYMKLVEVFVWFV